MEELIGRMISFPLSVFGGRDAESVGGGLRRLKRMRRSWYKFN